MPKCKKNSVKEEKIRKRVKSEIKEYNRAERRIEEENDKDKIDILMTATVGYFTRGRNTSIRVLLYI